ncbi:glycosyltransferase family 2 protein [Kluyvera cryocrescens]|uniref:glycosyltransferase family 2 protein n=1 Tax=Kluyvera cryocrescens TaxID=580 RepID=UPI00224A6C95|nr:glycosyltransferase family 2 protein [Kluyvera cryocrescens]MCX2869418.1 glycosyltransferase family 2 protein [Kluyvera cryocrescens]
MHLVSIIMPTFNSSSTVADSIKSVLEQSYSNWELLITDDCSTDDTLGIIQSFSDRDSRIKVFQNTENSGAGISRNNSISMAKGRFIAFLDSDDMWFKDKLFEQINFMLENDYALTYTNYIKVDENNNVKGEIHPPLDVTYQQLLKSNVIGCLTAIYDVDKIGKVYMPAIRKRQDMALWLKILQVIPKAHCLPKELAIYKEGHQSLSSNKVKILYSQWVFYRNYLNFGVLKSLWYFQFYIVKALKKHKFNS